MVYDPLNQRLGENLNRDIAALNKKIFDNYPNRGRQLTFSSSKYMSDYNRSNLIITRTNQG